jgi:hypothetical protein
MKVPTYVLYAYVVLLTDSRNTIHISNSNNPLFYSILYGPAVFNVKRILKKYRQYSSLDPRLHSNPGTLWSGSGKIVLTAVAMYANTYTYLF